MNYSAALSSTVHAAAQLHLVRSDRQEDLCFALWYPSQGRDRFTGLIQSLILPQPDDRVVHGNVSFAPQYFERAVAQAHAAGAGLAFFHSHLGPGWQGMSDDDVKAEQRIAPATSGATELPLLGMTIGADGAWSGRFWHRKAPRQYSRSWCESVRVVGNGLAVTYNDSLLARPTLRPELTRTISAWGPAKQADLARLRVGVVGTGSVGSIVAESLARMGIASIRLLDFDAVELINLDRLLHATRRDIERAKVRVLASAIRRSATASPFSVEPFEFSVVEEDGYRAALDCDVLFCCVDRPWPRCVLNSIAYGHLIPVVDGGVAIRTLKDNSGLRSAEIRAHVAAPSRRCMECLGQYGPGFVSTERDGYLDNPGYIAGLPPDHPLRRNENVFAFSVLATGLEVLQFLTMMVAPFGLTNAGSQLYHFVPSKLDVDPPECEPTCPYRRLEAIGDRTSVTFTGRHEAAEEARARRRGIQWLLRRARYRFGF
ncbi:MAG TPA: ThiF family adenylyltransferase [Tepidisphaeraceae bacterium]|jgi:hypothetical protein|nr:ThiF family adenylyltransferase [Tepidisphaeraceae bacterium]